MNAKKENIEQLYYKTFDYPLINIQKLSSDGSNRQYFRLYSDKNTVIGVYNEDKKENIAFIDYAGQLKSNGINVPEVYSQDLNNNVYLLEDLGDVTLFNFISNHNAEEILDWYKKIIKDLVAIQLIENFSYNNAYPREAFDRQSIQWDLNYFKYYFLKLAGIAFNEEELEKDFTTLTNYLLSTDTDCFMYRDFQSRNIMLHNNKAWYIDFQGGRKGALQYDIASLLYDAKANINPKTREYLLDLYIEELSKYKTIDKTTFRQYFYAYVYVRIMQAMGSYGYRGYFENKTSFLKSIPFALSNLKYLEENVTLPIELNTLHLVFKRIISSEKLLSLSRTKKKLTVNIKSFSYKKGYPHDISGNGGGFVFDCRALPNPGREERFKNLTGLDTEVIHYLQSYNEVDYFLENAMNLIMQSIENYLQRGFSNLSVYFGCTGGQHRSVYCARTIADILIQNSDLNVIVQHIEQNI